MVCFIIKMEGNIKESGIKILCMDMGNCIISLTYLHMTDNGNMENSMVEVSYTINILLQITIVIIIWVTIVTITVI